MERHLSRTLTGSTSTSSEPSTGAVGVTGSETAFNRDTVFDRGRRAWPARDQSHPLSENVSVWMHTLVLTGELTHRSAHTLEVEIERLFEEGVTGITLDLRQLAHIDPIGVGVIAFRARLCRRQGHSFVLIPGSRSIQRVFEQAGVVDRLPFQEDELGARRLRAARPACV